MKARFASVSDAEEIVRLAGVMFASMGMDIGDEHWVSQGRRHVRARLGDDLAVFVVDHPSEPGRLVASAGGTLSERLPTPANPLGLAGYVQWVCTDSGHRGRGLGRQVMTSLLQWFDDRDVATVELHATSVAEPLYISLGFDDDGPRALRRRIS